jgi:hypothetical protein
MEPTTIPRAWVAGAALAALAGCADGEISDGGRPPPAPTFVDAAPVPDAAPAPIRRVLAQTRSRAIVPGAAIGCVYRDADGAVTSHDEASWYRAFDLAAAGVPGGLAIEAVAFGVETAESPDGAQPVDVRLHLLDGALAIAHLTPLAATRVDLGDRGPGLVTTPIRATAPAGATVVIELHVASGVAARRLFLPGANGGGQTAPGYLRAPATGCDLDEPTDLAALGFPDSHLVLELIGEG